MGRQSRQQHRAHERRNAGKPKQRRVGWSKVIGIAVVLVAVVFFIAQALGVGGASSTSPASAKTIDGIQCSAETVTYHVHTHLTILDRGTPLVVPQEIGYVPGKNCLYWFHTHNASGAIHIEAPSPFGANLGKFFDVWGEPLSKTRASFAATGKGRTMIIYVNQKLYSGDPRTLPLANHTNVTIEVGPPFKPPVKFNFGKL